MSELHRSIIDLGIPLAEASLASSRADDFRFATSQPLRLLLPCTFECGLPNAQIDTALVLSRILASLQDFKYPAVALIPLTMPMATDYGRGINTSHNRRTDDTEVVIVSPAPQLAIAGQAVKHLQESIPFFPLRFTCDVAASVWPEVPNTVRLCAILPHSRNRTIQTKPVVEFHPLSSSNSAAILDRLKNLYATFYIKSQGLNVLVVSATRVSGWDEGRYYPSNDQLCPTYEVTQTILQAISPGANEQEVTLSDLTFRERLIALGPRLVVLAILGSQGLPEPLGIEPATGALIIDAMKKWGEGHRDHIGNKIARARSKIETAQRWFNSEVDMYNQTQDRIPDLVPPQFPFDSSPTCLLTAFSRVLTSLGYSP